MVYLPTFTIKKQPNAVKYTIHGSYGYAGWRGLRNSERVGFGRQFPSFFPEPFLYGFPKCRFCMILLEQSFKEIIKQVVNHDASIVHNGTVL